MRHDDDEAGSTSFGTLLFRYRSAAGLTQRALADLSTISVRAIRDLEQRRARPREDTVRLISDALRLGRQVRADLERSTDHGRGNRPLRHDYDAALAAPPAGLTAMVGRDAEAATLTAELVGATHRLVTILGLPGVGKSRLAVEVARTLHGRQRMPVLWLAAPEAGSGVAESTVRDERLAALVRDAGAALFGQIDGARAIGELAELVGGRDTLLVLDGVTAHGLRTLELLGLLRDCPRLRIMVTAPRQTGLAGERPFLLGPLTLPDTDAGERRGAASVRLFTDHLRRVRPDHRLAATDGPVLAEICRLLDGLPPALAQAASWLAVYDLEPLRDILFTDPFAVLDPVLADRLGDWVSGLPAEQRAVLDRLRELGEVSLDDIVAATGRSLPEVGRLLRDLLLCGVIRTRHAGGQSRFQVLSLVGAVACRLAAPVPFPTTTAL